MDFLKLARLARFWSNVEVVELKKCWEWRRRTDSGGYGAMSIAGKSIRAHVISYKFFNQDYNPLLVIDHKCRNRKCVNPKHLRQVTRRINSIENSISITVTNSQKKECKNGHEFSEENTKLRKYKETFHRTCIACSRNRDRSRGKK